ncbi:aromatic acid exporter family protein [Priestia sp. SB1]|uniref:FUSC family protein n=1 Tax=Priestia TaxID=2800373 RepID=UPI0031775F03
MNIGARIIKTGLSVTLALIIANLLNMQPAVISAVAAVIAIQPSIMRSWKYIKEVTVTNVVGALFATLGFYAFGTQPIFIGIIVILTIAVNLKLGLSKSVNLSVLTVIAILTSPLHESTLSTAGNRFSLVAIGVISSFLINIFVLPPKHDQRFYDSIRKLNEKLSTLLRVAPEKEMSIATYKEEKNSLDKLYNKTRELFDLLNEEKRRMWVKDRHMFIKRIVIFRQAIKVVQKEIGLFEKIEKNLNNMDEISNKGIQEVKDTLNELLQYQESIFWVYEGKIVPKPTSAKGSKEKRERIVGKLKCTVNELMKHYDPANEELWWRLFPIVNALIETENELEQLEILVVNYKLRRKEKKGKTKRVVKKAIEQLEK